MMPIGTSTIPARTLNDARDQEIQIGLFELQLARFLEPLDEGVLELELADEADAVGEAMAEQQDEPVEVEDGRPAVGPVQVHLHVAGNRAGARSIGRLAVGEAGSCQKGADEEAKTSIHSRQKVDFDDYKYTAGPGGVKP